MNSHGPGGPSFPWAPPSNQAPGTHAYPSCSYLYPLGSYLYLLGSYAYPLRAGPAAEERAIPGVALLRIALGMLGAAIELGILA